MRYLNIKPVSTLTRITEVSHILGANNSLDDMGMVRDLLADNETLVSLLSKVAEEADEQGSRGTTNLVEDLIESHGKNVWMLRSFLQ
jgi:DNA-binding ferritin-like protein